MQNEITKPHDLLSKDGNLIEAGYSKTMLLNYNRENIKTNKLRIKEWDYYLIYNNNFGVALTIADNGYMGLIGASLLDFKNAKEHTKNVMTFMPCGKFNLPKTSVIGDINFKNKNIDLSFKINKDNSRTLKFKMNNFKDKKTFVCEFTLECEPKQNMCIATPFDKPKHFYYNQKIVGFVASGYVEFDNEIIHFDNNSTVGILDWGRGVWTYKNTWYWSSAIGYVNKVPFGFNLGYGFGNTKNATENMLFYNGMAHKLEDIKFEIPFNKKGKEDFLKPWKFTSNNGRFEMEFVPILDRYSNTNALIISSNQHQVFGKFSGYAILDNGQKIEIKDFLGFAEKVVNKW